MPVRTIPKNSRSLTGKVVDFQSHRAVAFESALERDFYVLLDFDPTVRSRRKITFPNLRDCCTILDERSPCFAWEYLGALVRCRCPVGIDTRSF
jgi:hypothetical protein